MEPPKDNVGVKDQGGGDEEPQRRKLETIQGLGAKSRQLLQNEVCWCCFMEALCSEVE